ncbi:AsnC family protein [Saxibacter everestensis]|uniref:AsnC family protein n=1 Tax=Saxibacter everestensis TaxID=2909229 RepID=A0ABY8QPL2_9MICO|nr:AsnC family protein [Brevibacteriaceae bacterium ZFBP1038]
MAVIRTSLGPDDAGSGSPLRALAEISREQAALREKEHFYVLNARAAGYSWQAIAAVVGVSKQAMHRRYRDYRAQEQHN